MQEEIEAQQPIIEKESLKKTILKNSAFNFLTSIIGRLGGLIFTIIIARLLQPELFGLYSLSTSVALIFFTFIDLGINSTLLRYIAHALGKKDKNKAAAYFKYLLKIKLISTFTVALILFLVSYPLSFYLFNKPELFPILLFCSIYLIVVSLIGFYESIFYAVQKFSYITIKETLYQILRISLAVLGIYLLSNKVIGTLAGISLATFIAIIFLFLIIKKRFSFLFRSTEDISSEEKRKVLKFLIYLTVGSITGIFFSYIDTVMLGMFVKSEFIGFYRAAFTLVWAVVGLITITNVLLPIFTQLKGRRLEKVFNTIFKYSALISFPAAFGLILIAKPFINIIFGSSYIEATIPLCILSFIIIEGVLSGMFTWLLTAKGKPDITLRILIIAAIINITLTYILITSLLKFGAIYSVLGAAAAIVISRYYNFIALARAARMKLNIKIQRSSIIKPLIASIFMFILLLLFQNATKFIWPLSIIEIVFAVIVYSVILILIKAINIKEIRSLIK
jgi:O-antigen/teichoic acid export membrane protein